MTDIDVIILSAARTPELKRTTEDALESLLTSEDPDTVRFHLIVIESCPEAAMTGYNGAQTMTPSEPFGYHRYMNIGIRAGNAPFVCMCNNDLVFHHGWATEILKALAQDPNLMSASPYCGYFHGSVLPSPSEAVITGYQNGIHVAGWCLFARRSVFQTIGALDERFIFWFCDDDYRLTLKEHGLAHALVTTSRVDHLGSRTLNAEQDSGRKNRITRRQALLFHYKWGHRSWILYKLKQLKFALVTAWRG